MAEPDLQPQDRERLAQARAQFEQRGTYLNTASIGLPPRRALDALHAALDEWREGRAEPAGYDAYVEAARAAYASLVGVRPGDVAIGNQVSVFAGLVAASLPDDAEVLTAEGDFTSILFPFHAQRPRGVEVREVPLHELAGAVSPRTQLVSVSAVQSSDGRIADLDSLRTACEAVGARILLDTTQATGWLPIDAGRYAYTVAAGYKWLMTPRGTAYATVQEGLLNGLTPNNAGWYAGADPWDSIYGTPLRLAETARRFDISPAWHSWVAAVPALELLASVGAEAVRGHSARLADRFCAAVGLPPGGSAIVSAAADAQAANLMREAGILGAARAGRLRLSFHLCNDERDVDLAADVLSGHVAP